MKSKKYDAVELKRTLQKKAEQKFAGLSEKEQLEFLRRKFGHLTKAQETNTQEKLKAPG